VPAVPGRSLAGYDLLILRKGARTAFGGVRDKLLLLVAIPVLLLLAAQGAGNVVAALGDLPPPARLPIAMLTGLAPNLAVARRLAHLREHSVVAPAALRADAAAAYALFWNALPAAAAMTILLAGTASLAAAAAEGPSLLLAYGTGGAAAFAASRAQAALGPALARRLAGRGAVRRLQLAAPGRGQRVRDLMASRTGLPRLPFRANMPAFAALGAATAAGGAVPLAHAGERGAAASAVCALLLLFPLLLRQQAALLRYLLFLGDSPTSATLVPIALGASATAGALAVAAVATDNPVSPAVAAAGALLLFAAAALLRALHHATKPRRAADFAIQLDLAALIAAAIAVPWLAPPLLAARLFLLHRQARALRHIAP
jgi:hypothetical protein